MNGMEDLIVGVRYRVTFSDCCVDGWFVDTFVGLFVDEDGDPYKARFENALIGPSWGQITYEEI